MSENSYEFSEEQNTINFQASNTEKQKVKKKKKNKESAEDFGVMGTIYDAISVVISSIMIIAVAFTFVFRLVGVDGFSMLNTLQDGDWLIVTPYYTEPKYGDIVISTKKTAAEGNLVKRVIAVEGDEVILTDEGKVIVNGKELNETYIISDGMAHGDLSYPVTVPDGCVMLMGDNRPVSWDSRYSSIGFAEKDYLLGKAQLRIASTDPRTGKITKTDEYGIYSNFPK